MLGFYLTLFVKRNTTSVIKENRSGLFINLRANKENPGTHLLIAKFNILAQILQRDKTLKQNRSWLADIYWYFIMINTLNIKLFEFYITY